MQYFSGSPDTLSELNLDLTVAPSLSLNLLSLRNISFPFQWGTLLLYSQPLTSEPHNPL